MSQSSARTRRQLLRSAGAAPFIALGASVSLVALSHPAEAQTQVQEENIIQQILNLLNDQKKHKGGGGGKIACFLAGTRISTPFGARNIEELTIGEEVETAAGPKPVKWIGRRTFLKPTHGVWQDEVIPIRITRSAISDNSPSRDLYVSPWHCVLVDGVLIPAMYLTNNTTILRSMPSGTAAIDYYHIEFDDHEIVYAEGAAVESFLDDGASRDGFANREEYEQLYGAEGSVAMEPCAPIVKYKSRGKEMIGRVRSAISTVVDIRDPIQIACDRITARAEVALV
jgi:hypothetical protein